MATDPPITQQITKDHPEIKRPPVNVRLEDVEDCLIYDRHGVSTFFKELYQDRKSVVIFVRVGNIRLFYGIFTLHLTKHLDYPA